MNINVRPQATLWRQLAIINQLDSAHATLEKFEIAALFVQLGLPKSREESFISTIIPTVHTNMSWEGCLICTVRLTVHTNMSWEESFISTVRPTVHTNLSWEESSLETLFKLKEFENTGFSFSRGRQPFWIRGFAKTMASR